MTRKTRLKNVLAVCMLTVFGMVITCLPTRSLAAPEEIPFAVIEPLTGPVAFAGIPGKNGAEMAVEKINSQGGIQSLGGAKLKPMYYDTESKPDVAKTRAEKAVNDGVVAIVGSPQSAVGMLISQVAERNKVPNIVDMGSGDFLTQRGFKYVFRIMPNNTQQTRSDLDFIANVGKARGEPVKRVAMVYEDTASGQDGYNKVSELVSEFGMELVAGLAYPHAASDVSALVSKLKREDPDFLIMYSWENDSIMFLRTMNEMGYCPPGIIGKSFSPKVIEEVGKLSEYLYGTAYFSHEVDPPGAPEGRNQKIYNEYEEKYGTFNPLMALTYTSVMVLADALERAGSTDRKALRDALAETDMTGADGIIQIVERIQFDEKGDSIYARTLVDQIRGGTKVIVYPEWAAQKPPVFPMPDWDER